MKYFYCDDNNVYTMIKYDLYHNNYNVNYPTFYNWNHRHIKLLDGAFPKRKLRFAFMG